MIELEDNVGDIVGKAQRGLSISDSDLANRAGVNADAVRKARDGQADEATLRAIAPVLDLDANALVDLAQGKWKPDKLENFDGLAQFNTSYDGMLVNAYLVWDPAAKHAAAFDTGADSAGMVKLATKENLSIKLILLTHTHPDHVADLPRLREETGAEIFAPEREPLPGAEKIEEGKRFRVGKVDIEARLLLGEHARLGRRTSEPAVLLRPRDPGPASVEQRALPLLAATHVFGVGIGARIPEEPEPREVVVAGTAATRVRLEERPRP